MIALRSASPDDLPRIVELLREANDTPYDLARVAEEKCFGPGLAGPPRAILATEGETLLGIAVAGRALRLIAVRRGSRRRGVGTELLREAETTLPASFEAGGEGGNYFVPGIPAVDGGMQRFFRGNGYVELPDEAVDLSVRLEGNPLIKASGEASVRRATHAERERVLQFVSSEFAAAWAMEAERAFEHDEPSLFIAVQEGRIAGFSAHAVQGGRIAGFSAHDANNRGLGFFGPEGVIPSMRGRGLGGSLLLASLADLQRRGFERTIIAWAAAHDFYHRLCGAEVAHRFIRMRKMR